MKRIAVIRGGPSSEHDISLLSGAHFLEILAINNHEPIDIIITKECVWTVNNKKITPTELVDIVDCAVIALHGEYGEDGQIQELLENLSIPYTGSNSTASCLRADKFKTKKILQENGIQVPQGSLITRSTLIEEKLFPLFVKPNNGGSSINSGIVNNQSELDAFLNTIDEEELLAEEYITGKELTCGVLTKWNNKNEYALEPVYIELPPDAPFFDLKTKYSSSTKEHCPSGLDVNTVEVVKHTTERVHNILGAYGYSRVDMILHPTKGLYVLELNSLPGFTANSLLPKELAYEKISNEQFLEHVIKLSMSK